MSDAATHSNQADLEGVPAQICSDDDAVLSVADAARMTGMTQSALTRARQTPGAGPPFLKLGHRTIGYRRGAVRAWLREREFASTLEAKSQ